MKRRIFACLLSIIVLITTCFSEIVCADTTDGIKTDKNTITVYFTLSEDGEFVTGKDEKETVLAHVPVTISYFDLAAYNLEEYYRYEADSFENGGEYIGAEVIEQPTLLHLFIKMLEKYYLGDETKLVVNDREQDALSISGSPTSLYMTRFWGHDENLMYYVNHKYPLQAQGWGSTSDYILLEDGMEIDVAMYTDWDFYHKGAFAYFTSSNIQTSASGQYEASVNENISLTMRGTSTNAAYDGDSSFVGESMVGETVVYCKKEQAVSDYTNKKWKAFDQKTDENGSVIISFSEPGTYYVSSTPLYESYYLSSGNACVAPPIAVIDVTGENTGGEEYGEDYAGTLISDVIISDGVADTAAQYSIDTEFSSSKTDYSIVVPDYQDSVCIKTVLNEGVPDRTKLKVIYQDISGENREVEITGNDELGKKLSKIISKGEGQASFRLTAVCENQNGSDVTAEYNFEIKRLATLDQIRIDDKSNKENISLMPEFKNDIYEYSVSIQGTTDSVALNIQPFSNLDYEMFVDGVKPDSEGSVTIDFKNTAQKQVNITVSADECVETVYKVTFNKQNLAEVEMSMLKGSVLQIENSSGKNILRYESDGSLYNIKNLSEGGIYTYTVSKFGYNIIRDSFVAKNGLKIEALLSETTINESINTELTVQWSNFRGNNENNGLTNFLTPTDYTNSQLYWAKKVGTGYGSGAPSSPILVDGYLVYTTATTIVKVDTITGEVVQSGNMVKTSAFNITPPTYAEGMIFVALASGTIQAFNAETLESLWVYQDPLFGQPNSPITYHDGYIYTGFWTGERGNANYVCISITDEKVNETTEDKYATWTRTSKGGFYWAGSYVCKDFMVVGTDDGEKSNEQGISSVLVLNPMTGELMDEYKGIAGDTRSSICYDETTDRCYFTSKGGGFYSMAIDDNGKITDVKEISLGGASTSTPVVCNGRAYVGVKGNEQFGANSGHGIAVIDLEAMTIAYTLETRGYPQTSGLATTGYEEKDGYTYVYFVDNYEPGKIRVMKDQPGQREAVITRKSEYDEDSDNNALFTPKGEQANYALCSLIVDEYGTMYFKNDSAYMMALGSKIAKIQVTKNPDKLNYKVGEVFDSTGMEVTATYSNGMKRNITRYVTFDSGKLTADMSDVEIRFEHVRYNDELLNYQSFDPLIDTVEITVADEAGMKAAQNVVNKIGAIGNTITLNSKDRIKEARKAYDGIDSSLEVYVTNYEKLVAAEKKYLQLVAEYFKNNKLKVTVTAKSINAVSMKWNKNTYADGYMILRSERSTGPYKELRRTTGLSFSDTAVTLGTKYYYKLVPYVSLDSQNKNVVQGNGTAVNIKISLPAPKGVKLSSGKKRVKLKWKRISGASGYVIYRSTKKKGKYKKVKTVKAGRTISFTDKKVKKKKTYYYKIRGYRTVNGKKIYGTYSVVKKIKVKK